MRFTGNFSLTLSILAFKEVMVLGPTFICSFSNLVSFQKHKVGLEEEYSFEELKILREVVYKKITKEGNIIKVGDRSGKIN